MEDLAESFFTCEACRYTFIANEDVERCPDCGKVIHLYGESHIDELAEKHGTEVLAKMPIDPAIPGLCDKGLIELFENNALEGAATRIEELLAH